MAEKMKPSGIDWIGDIPNNWETSRIKYHYQISLGKMLQPIQENSTDTLEHYMCSANITWAGVDTSILKQMWFSPAEKKQYRLLDGDLLVSEGGDVAVSCIWRNELDECYLQNAVHRVRQNALSDNRFIYYWLFFLKNYGIVDLVCNKATIAHFTKEKFGELPICIMSIDEQVAIADFLDKECGQIDSVAADLEKQIALLQQYKKSLITETVTKGLDKSVPMKDSGVEWIGEIPEHWEISRVRHLASLCSGATPSKDVLSYWEGNIPWVSSQEVKSDIIKDTSLHISEEAINSCSTQLMPAGTLVMVVRSGILQHTIPVALLGVPVTINQDIKAFQFNHLMLPAYFKYYIQGENDALLSVIIKDKTTVESIDNQLLLSLKIMVPPIEEQKAIVAFLNYKCGYIDKILNDKQEQLNLLMQHKKSLIYEYVTGKKRVKEVQ